MGLHFENAGEMLNKHIYQALKLAKEGNFAESKMK
ncbi:PTS system, cellobiose-specific IIA component [Streptococcus agalactiae H36B]|nr:PTS system, cellobiose-specific IIA component [Streptococcus agalactiae H36B]